MKFKVLIMVLSANCLVFPASANPASAKKPELERICKKPVKLRGPGNTISSIAELKTIVMWSEKVGKKYGREHSQWHYAKAKSIKCKKDQGSNYFYCDLSAMPCVYRVKKEEEGSDIKTAPKPQQTKKKNRPKS